jgi:sialate O-acetylesterase
LWESNKRKGNEWKGERIKAFHAEKKSRKEENSMGDLRLPRLLGDYAVLQRGKDIHIWGWDLPGRTVSISLAREEADRRLPKNKEQGKAPEQGRTSGEKTQAWHVRTDETGSFSAFLPAREAGGPYTIRVEDEAGEWLERKHLLIGDVWYCSGQSNMELPVSWVAPYYEEEIKNCENPYIRSFKIVEHADFHGPLSEPLSGKWKPANPKNVLDFSACTYFFAKKRWDRTGVPVGILNVSLGGAKIEAFMSREMLKGYDDCLAEAERYAQDGWRKEQEEKNEKSTAEWYGRLQKEDAGIKGAWMQEEAWNKNKENGRKEEKAEHRDDSFRIDVPFFFRNTGYRGLCGSVWLARHFTVTKEMAAQDSVFCLGTMVDADEVYVNGSLVGCTAYQYPERRYPVKAGMLHAGENFLVIRLISEQGEGRITPGKPFCLKTESGEISLSGTFQAKVGAVCEKRPPVDFINWRSTGLYNGMAAPCEAFPIAGFLWYQGEANAHMPGVLTYADKLKRLIVGYRKARKDNGLPFLYVQLPNFKIETYYGNEEERDSDWGAMRLEQEKVLTLPGTGMVRTIGLGEDNDLHPHNKKDVGELLADLAEKMTGGPPAHPPEK